MAEITSYQQFAGLVFNAQVYWIRKQLGLYCVCDNPILLAYDSDEEINEIELAMIGGGWNYSASYIDGRYMYHFWRFTSDLRNGGLIHFSARKSEAIIHAVAKALLGGK